MFFGGIKEGAYILKDMRKAGLAQVFACGDGCWSVGGFIKPAASAATAGEGVRVLSAAPAVGNVPGSAEFAERYKARFGPINNYAASSYDSARILMSAIEAAAKTKGGLPNRAHVLATLKGLTFKGVAYAAPEAFDAKGDNTAADIFVNEVDGDRFREIDQIVRVREARSGSDDWRTHRSPRFSTGDDARGPGGGLSHCRVASAKRRRLRNCQAAATAVRHVVFAAARSARCVWAEVRWRRTLKAL